MADSEAGAAAGPSGATGAADAERLVVVTGLSGAGKSTALRALADAGFYCVEHLPPSLVPATVAVCRTAGMRRVALGIDVRVAAFLEGAVQAVRSLEAGGTREPGAPAPMVLFLDASDEVLVRRFSETRRPHPLLADVMDGDAAAASVGTDHALAVLDGVRLERTRLSELRRHATVDVDTSLLSVHELRRVVLECLPNHRAPRMVTRVVSFGFKYGTPLDADVLFDVRFVDNPHFVPGLRELSGTDPPVRAFVLGASGCADLIERLVGLLAFALPRYEAEGKSYLTIGIGCTGGRHRSVAIATEVALRLAADTGRRVGIVHRDVNRESIIDGVTPTRTSSDSYPPDTPWGLPHDAPAADAPRRAGADSAHPPGGPEGGGA